MRTGEGERDGSALLDALFEHAPIGLACWDRELRYRRVNAALAAIHRMAPEAIVGRRLVDVLGEEVGADLERRLGAVLGGGEPIVDLTVRGHLRTEAGAERELTASYFPVRDRGGAVVGLGGIIREVTIERLADAERERLLREAVQARARTQFIADAGTRMASSLDVGRALQELADLSVPTFADWCAISILAREGRLDTVAVAHADAARAELLWEMARRRPLHVDDAAGPAAVLRAGEPRLVAQVDDALLARIASDERHLAAMREIGIDSALVVPLRMAGRPIGTITFAFSGSGRRYGHEDVALARALASRAALHVENARLYTERSRIASTLQAGLAPAELPEVPGAELAVRYRPAGEANAVGGDFYDVYPTAGGAWTVAFGDVAGSGAEAAALTALTRHTLYAGSLLGGGAGANLRLLNEALLRRGTGEHFCTLVVAELRATDGGGLHVRLTDAGHPAPLVLRAGGALEEATASGTVVGAMAEPSFDDQELDLAVGDVLLLYTDGVVELRTADSGEGARRLHACAGGVAGRSAEEVVGAVERSVLAACGGEPHDDVTLLAIRAR